MQKVADNVKDNVMRAVDERSANFSAERPRAEPRAEVRAGSASEEEQRASAIAAATRQREEGDLQRRAREAEAARREAEAAAAEEAAAVAAAAQGAEDAAAAEAAAVAAAMADEEAQVDRIARAESLKTAGNERFKAGDYRGAVGLYSQAAELDPGSSVLFSNRSGALAALGVYEQALADADRCVSLRPDWAKGHTRKAAALHGLKRYMAAIEAYEAALVHEPGDSSAREALIAGRRQSSFALAIEAD